MAREGTMTLAGIDRLRERTSVVCEDCGGDGRTVNDSARGDGGEVDETVHVAATWREVNTANDKVFQGKDYVSVEARDTLTWGSKRRGTGIQQRRNQFVAEHGRYLVDFLQDPRVDEVRKYPARLRVWRGSRVMLTVALSRVKSMEGLSVVEVPRSEGVFNRKFGT